MAGENGLIFREVQRIRLCLRWLVMFSMVVAACGAVLGLREMVLEQDSPIILPVILLVIVGIGVPIAITVLLFTVKLETEIRSDGLYVRLFPFHIHYKRFVSEDLEQCYARQYRPILEYGGWGIRCGFGKSGRAYNMSGNKGVQLVFKDGRRLLIGSQRANELAEALGSVVKGT